MNPRPPRSSGFRMPAEWSEHEACWLAWPCDGELWTTDLKAAQREFRELCAAIADVDPQTTRPRGERLHVLVPDEAAERSAREALSDLPIEYVRIPFGDIWLRDTGPIFLRSETGTVAPACFRFNGWGEKYVLPHDAEVSRAIAARQVERGFDFDWILEGGAVEVDGDGTCITTRSCLLNPNRPPAVDAAVVERRLREALGVDKVLWIEGGLLNDHTDGHIDTIVRFVAPGVVVCMEARSANDPNADALERINAELRALRDSRGRQLQVIQIPSPGRVVDADGRVMPASYVNFFIGNRTVIVPTYGTRYDDDAVSGIRALFPRRRTVGLSAKAILSGGGAFHCITQQQPKAGGTREAG